MVCDYVELCCAGNRYGAFSVEELQDARRMQRRDDAEPSEATDRELLLGNEATEMPPGLDLAIDVPPLGEAPRAAGPAEADTEEDGGADEEGEALEDSGAPDSAQRDDAYDLEGEEIARHLAYRADTFGEAYPFDVREGGALELRELTDSRRLYLALLFAASLSNVREQADRNKLTTYFELLAPDALRGLLGETVSTYLFGTSTSAADEPHYSGSLWRKVQQLAQDLRLRLLADQDAPLFSHNSGDGGVDVVAFFPFDDPANRLLTILGQCACGRNPWAKMHEPSEQKWAEVLHFTSPVINALLIPQCFRATDGDWFDRHEIPKGMLLDRVRVIACIEKIDAELPIAPERWPASFFEAAIGSS